MTSFPSAAGQYLAAIRGLHALAETMYRFPAAFMRLIGPFFSWHCLHFSFYKLISVSKFYTHQGTIPAVCERTAKVRGNP